MTSDNNKVWKFLNSNLFLWFLGVITLSFFPFLWQESQKSREKKERVERLDNEFKGRLFQMFNILQRGTDSSEHFSDNDDSIEVQLILYEFKKPPDSTYKPKFYSSYKEFGDYNTVSILNELITFEKDKSQRDSLKHLSELIAVDKLIQFEPKMHVRSAPKFISDIKDSLILTRWER